MAPASTTLRIGHIPSSIGDVIEYDPQLLSAYRYLMISSIDSTVCLQELATATEIISRYGASGYIGDALLVPGPDIPEIAGHFALFNGFDEVWCFDDKPRRPKERGLTIVGPNELNSAEVPQSLLAWMTETDCRLALGDGVGLNYATFDDRVVERLVTVANRSG